MRSLNQLFSCLQNGQRAGKPFVKVNWTRGNQEVLRLLTQEGWIGGYGNQVDSFWVSLKYKQGEPVLKKIKQVSTSGRRVYYKLADLEKLSPSTWLLLSTSRGLVTNQRAQALRIGGEVFCQLY
jgi:small subunit ribosomal protein S8